MKRLVRATSVVLIATILCLIGVTIALNLTRSTLRTVATTQPTQGNPAKFTSKDQTYYGPDNLVLLRGLFSLLFVLLLLVLLFSLFTRSLLKTIEVRRRRQELLQTQKYLPAQPDFVIETGSISWIIPKSAKRAVIRSPSGWLPYLIGFVIVWLFFDLLFHFQAKSDSSPELVATGCAIGMVPVYFLMASVILNWTSVVTLDDAGVTLQWAGQTGRCSTFSYRSITDCLIEPSRWVPTLPCLTFKVPGRIRSEKTVRLELPSSADIPAVIQFLGAKGVVCADRR